MSAFLASTIQVSAIRRCYGHRKSSSSHEHHLSSQFSNTESCHLCMSGVMTMMIKISSFSNSYEAAPHLINKRIHIRLPITFHTGFMILLTLDSGDWAFERCWETFSRGLREFPSGSNRFNTFFCCRQITTCLERATWMRGPPPVRRWLKEAKAARAFKPRKILLRVSHIFSKTFFMH